MYATGAFWVARWSDSTLTLTLNDDGERRYRIDGKGEFVRWQVLRRLLEPLLF